MVEKLMNEYLTNAAAAVSVDYTGKKSVRQFNRQSDRMRAIVREVVSLGQDAVVRFSSLLNQEPAAGWAAHHLVEMADLDPQTLTKCFDQVKQMKLEAEAKGELANAMGEEMWLKEWIKKGVAMYEIKHSESPTIPKMTS